MHHVFLSVALLISAVAGYGSDSPIPSSHESIEESARAASLQSWKISLAALVGSQAADAATSYGMRELNPLLASANGGFEIRAAVTKMGVTGALVGIEYLIVRKYPRSAGVISKLNWSTGIVTMGFAAHNFAIK